jgi:receptor protein-tyrosine kinase
VAATPTEPGIREQFATLGRRKGTIALTAGLAVAVAIVASLAQTPRYRSEAVVLVPTSSINTATGEATEVDAERAIRNEVDFVNSDAVSDAVAEELGDDAPISVGSADDRDSLRFSATATDADEAADIANTYTDTYISVRRAQAVRELGATRASIQQRINSLNTQIGQISLNAPLTPTDQARVDSLTSERVELAATLRNLQLSVDLNQNSGPQVIRAAEPADGPFEPNLLRNVSIALGVGLLLGIGLAFVREQLDDTVTSRNELEVATGGVPVLALVPRSGDRRDKGLAGLVTLQAAASPAAEAYRALRTSLQFLGVERQLHTILVTSPGAGDGKSTTVANLAVAIAQAGRTCGVICGDLRRPAIHRLLGVGDHPGLTTVLLGEIAIEHAFQPVPDIAGLAVLGPGALPPNPSELLSGDAATKALAAASELFDVLLIDAPPVLPVTDPLVLAQHVDGVVLVTDARHTGLADVREAWQRLTQVAAPLVGTVLNGADVTEDAYSY